LSETLLVCYMEFSPVGHVVELLRYALGYHAADPSRRIGVLLPANAPRELADLCPFVDAVYPVSPRLDDLPASLAQVPRDWDWIVDNPRRYDPTHVAAWDGLDRFFAATERALRARRGRTVIGVEPPSYRPHQQLRLPIPDADREAAHNLLADAEVRIAVMPTGSGPRAHYPSAGSWELILRGLTQRFPAVRFCLLGKLRADERTRSTFGVDEFARLLAAFPDVVDGFDRPIVEQLALVEACDLFLSPHTGFGMAALAVATPWLTISGGSWGEYFFNGVPFYSLLPDPERFGAYTPYHPPPLLAGDEDGEGPRTPSMSRGRIAHDLDELLEAAALLVEDRVGCVKAFMQLVGTREALHQGGRIGALGLAEPRRLGSDRRIDSEVPAQALGMDGVGCSAGRRSGGPAPGDRGRRSATSRGIRCGRSAPTAPHRRWRWAPAPVSPPRRCPPNGTRRRTRGRTSCPGRGQESGPADRAPPAPRVGCGPAGRPRGRWG
jgi:hypothetical protein